MLQVPDVRASGKISFSIRNFCALPWRRPTWRMRLVPRLLRDRSGVSAIEFAIVGPLFFIVLLGILIFAIYFGTVHSVQQIAAEAARATVQGITAAERAELAQNHVKAIVGSYPLLDPQYLSVEANTSASDPNLFNVSIVYDASRSIVFAFEGLIPMPPKTISRSAVVRRGGY
ncbi:MAG TPA: pilus assembly protein [Xanthobacteraceae bacterium]|nr:pilus assembly protein [Xanthobacteraceae bacterium]